MKKPKLNNSYKILIQSYTEYLQTLGFADSTVYDYPRFVADFLFYIEQKGINHIKQLESKTVFTYFTHLEQSKGKRTKQTFSTSHLNRNFLAVDKFLEFLHHTGAQNTPSPTCYKLEHVRKKPLEVLNSQEVQALYNTVPFTFPDMHFSQREPRQMVIKLVLDLCYGCGLRKSEALNVKLNDVNFDQRIIHVKQGKNYKDRFVPMSQKVYENIRTFVYQYRSFFNEDRFIGQSNERTNFLYPFGDTAIAQAIELLIKYSDNDNLKAKKPHLHTLRHSIATQLLQNGMDIERIALFLGHSTLESTQIYTHILNEYENEL